MGYRFSYSDVSVYDHVMSLVDCLEIEAGVVLDIGCGYGAVAEPLSSRGFEYVGIDIDKDSIDDLHDRGFEAHEQNLFGLTEPLSVHLRRIAAGRKVSLILALDVIEHCPDTTAFLDQLRSAIDVLDNPQLVVSIPNVAHLDVAARLLAGEFSYTPTGLLDSTHVHLWTAQSVAETFHQLGWKEVGTKDYELVSSDQHDPQHPLLARASLLGRWIHWLRSSVDPFGSTVQFVRAFEVDREESIARALARSGNQPAPFLSIVIRTQGLRLAKLREALLCLAAQSDLDFEVALVVHQRDENLLRDVQELVAEFGSDLSKRVSVVQALGIGRAHPLNVGISHATGTYVAFLDDDDLVTADWVAVFRRGAIDCPGRIIRSVAVVQEVMKTTEYGAYVPCGSFDMRYSEEFDFVQSLETNHTPIHTFAVPMRVVDLFKLRFDESLPVMEDWDFLMRAAGLIGVYDTRRVTGIYHWWVDGSGSAGAVQSEVWEATKKHILGRLVSQPMLIDASSVHKMYMLRAAVHKEEVDRLRASADSLRASLAAFENAEMWKLTKPLRYSVDALRSVRARLKSVGRPARPRPRTADRGTPPP